MIFWSLSGVRGSIWTPSCESGHQQAVPPHKVWGISLLLALELSHKAQQLSLISCFTLKISPDFFLKPSPHWVAASPFCPPLSWVSSSLAMSSIKPFGILTSWALEQALCPHLHKKKPKRQPRHATPSFEKEGWRHNPCPNYFQAVRRCLCNAQVLSTHLLNYVNGRDFTSFSISIGHITNSLHFTLVFDHTRQLVAVLPRASYFTTLYHCFLLCEMGEIISPFQVHCRDQITKATY